MNNNTLTQKQKWLTLACVGIGTFLSSLNSSLTNTILPTIEKSLHISLGQSEWIVLIYLLVLTVSLIPIGRLSDLWGHRPIFLSGFLIFSLAAILCGLSGSFRLLFWGRALLALGGAMILAVGPAIVSTTFPAGERGQALGLQAFMTYIGLSLGPLIGGSLTHIWGWQTTFFISVPFGIGGFFLGLRVIPEIRVTARKDLDRKGILCFVFSMIALTLLLNSNSLKVHRSLLLPLLLLIFIVSFRQFLVTEKRTASPMMDLRLFRIPDIGFGASGAALNYLCFFLTLFLIPYYFDRVLHSSPLITGLYLTITPLFMTICSPVAGALSDRLGSRTFSRLGMLFSTISLILFGIMAQTTVKPLSFTLLILGLVCSGLGTGTFAAPNNSAILGAAPLSQQGVASGILATFRYFGMIAGTTIGGSLFDLLLKHFLSPGQSSESAFLQAFTAVMGIGAVFGILGFVCASRMKRPN